MTAPALRRKIVVRTAAVARVRRRRIVAAISAMALLAMAAALALLQPQDRVLALPMCVLAFVTLGFVLVLWLRDGAPPVFEAGTLCVLANAVYGIVPLLGFVLMHGQWDPLSDTRLQQYPFIAGELALFGWRYALYAASFAAVYLLIRRRAAVRTTAFQLPRASMQTAVAIVFAGLYAVKIGLKVIWDYDPLSASYTDLAQVLVDMAAKPYLVLQIGHNILGALFVIQQAMVVLLLAYWRKRWCRYALVLWILFEVVGTVVKLGSRSAVVLLLITAGVSYHRLVKPVGFRMFVLAGAALLTAFLVVGVVRDRRADPRSSYNVITATNEFQSLFTTAFDIHKRKEAGGLDVPWQVYVSDLYMPIPSTFLPFEKVDPSSWYIDLIGQTGLGIGYMFGVMSQAVVGFGWLELVLRGAVLGTFLAVVQRWYVRHARDFWATLFFLFVSVWTYTTFRASTFYFLYFVVYHFVPVMLAAKLLDLLLSRIRRGTVALEPARA